MSGALVVRVLRDPSVVARLNDADWTGLLCAARAERLIGTLAVRIADQPIPSSVARLLADARADCDREQRDALWEAERAVAAVRPLGQTLILLKGAAYVRLGHAASAGRMVGDLDILVPHNALDGVEAALIDAGWEWVKPDPYDDHYYRTWMHELPPLIHRARDRMIDVHHSILPLTASPKPDMAAMMADAIQIGDGLAVLSPFDRIVHAVAHLIADGDLAGGLRNLWDIHCMIGADVSDWDALLARAERHGLRSQTERAARLCHAIYGTPVPPDLARLRFSDRLFVARMLDRTGWGVGRRKALEMAFYVRSHLLRMPLPMLLRHLFTKWRKGHRPV